MGGSASPDNGSPTARSAGGSAAGKATTSDERRATIDRKLDDSLGTLDREIRKEQEKTAQERDARAAANAGNGSADSEKSGDSDEDSEAKRDGDLKGSADAEGPKDGKDGDRKARPGDLKSDKSSQGNGKDSNGNSSSGGAQGSGSAAPSIPDGSDDDIVARRLRKAAEQETDPELKEKLWKEYVEYKKNSGK
jgi:hypothetical protein